jgi:hypothetical protein
MSERTLRHLIAQHLTEFLQDWCDRPGNTGTQPTEQDFAVWLGSRAGPDRPEYRRDPDSTGPGT